MNTLKIEHHENGITITFQSKDDGMQVNIPNSYLQDGTKLADCLIEFGNSIKMYEDEKKGKS